MSSTGTGISNKLRHEDMCVVSKKGCKLLKLDTSIEPIIVNKIITAIVLTIGPIELSEKTEKQIDMVATANNERYAKPNP